MTREQFIEKWSDHCGLGKYEKMDFECDLTSLFNLRTEEGLIDIEYLRSWHPELSDEELESLLKFSQGQTISYKECYGDGSIMYPMWEKWRAEQ